MNMTNNIFPDMTYKRTAPGNFNPNNDRMMSEQVPNHENLSFGYNHSRPAPFYTEPYGNPSQTQIPDPWNNPNVARQNDFNPTNVAHSNAPLPIRRISSVKKDEGCWWDWTRPQDESRGTGGKNQDERTKARGSSYQNAFNFSGDAGSYAKRNSRYSASPQHIRTVGIVPVTDLKTDNREPLHQPIVERIPQEQQYNRANHLFSEKRQDTFIGEETKPPSKPFNRTPSMSSTKVERAASMWDLFHPHVDDRDTNNAHKHRPPLPQIKRTETYQDPWQNAPYARDFQADQVFHQPPVMN